MHAIDKQLKVSYNDSIQEKKMRKLKKKEVKSSMGWTTRSGRDEKIHLNDAVGGAKYI